MRTLTDAKGREWEVSLTLGSAQRIEDCDFSLLTEKPISVLNMHAKDCMTELMNDAGIIFACIWCCIKPKADTLGVTQDDFTDSITGSVLQNGKEVWAEEMADFFPEVKTAILKILKAQKQGMKKVQKRTEQMSEVAVDRVNKELEEVLKKAEKETATGKMFG